MRTALHHHTHAFDQRKTSKLSHEHVNGLSPKPASLAARHNNVGSPRYDALQDKSTYQRYDPKVIDERFEQAAEYILRTILANAFLRTKKDDRFFSHITKLYFLRCVIDYSEQDCFLRDAGRIA